MTLQPKDLAYGAVIGFSGGRWLSAEWDKLALQKTVAVVAAKKADPAVASVIATTTPKAALRAALAMK